MYRLPDTHISPRAIPFERPLVFPVGKELETTSRAVKALSHPVRLQIVNHLAAGELSVKQLTDRINTHSQSSISQHLGYLYKNGIVRSRSEGTQNFYKITDGRTGLLIHMIMETFCPKSRLRTASLTRPTAEASPTARD